MSEKKDNKKSPFSIYWIYAIIGVAIIGFQLFMSSGSGGSIKSENTFGFRKPALHLKNQTKNLIF